MGAKSLFKLIYYVWVEKMWGLFVGSFLEVLDQVGNLVVLLLVTFLDSLHAGLLGLHASTHGLGIRSQIIHGLRAQLGEDTRKELLQSLDLSGAGDHISVGRNGSLDCEKEQR